MQETQSVRTEHRPETGHRDGAPRGTRKASTQAAFTRLELAMVLGMLALLGSLVLPVLANSRAQGDRAACLNNLREVGKAFQLWANDHNGENPWWVCAIDGGTRVQSSCPAPSPIPMWWGMQNIAYFHFAWISNELRRPAFLACPADDYVSQAVDYSYAAGGGYMHPNFRNNAVSYFLGLHARADYPQAVLCGDLNMKTNGPSAWCSSGITTASYVLWTGAEPETEWLPGVHGLTGNLLLNDGHTETTSSAGLRQLLAGSWKEQNVLHVLYPR